MLFVVGCAAGGGAAVALPNFRPALAPRRRSASAGIPAARRRDATENFKAPCRTARLESFVCLHFASWEAMAVLKVDWTSVTRDTLVGGSTYTHIPTTRGSRLSWAAETCTLPAATARFSAHE